MLLVDVIVIPTWSQTDVPGVTIPSALFSRPLVGCKHWKQCFTNIYLICHSLCLEHHFPLFCLCSNLILQSFSKHQTLPWNMTWYPSSKVIYPSILQVWGHSWNSYCIRDCLYYNLFSPQFFIQFYFLYCKENTVCHLSQSRCSIRIYLH